MKNKHPIKAVLITIEAGNVLDADEVVRVEPDDQIVFVVINNDPAVTYYVWIDPGEIVQREDIGTTSFTNPLQSPRHFKKLKPFEVDLLKHHVRPSGHFGRARAIPYTTYKYTIRSSSVAGYDANNVPLDPDIDVVQP